MVYFDNRTGATQPLGETKDQANATGPRRLAFTPAAFIVVEVRVLEAPHAFMEQGSQSLFKRLNNGWKLVGLERTIDPPPVDHVQTPSGTP